MSLLHKTIFSISELLKSLIWVIVAASCSLYITSAAANFAYVNPLDFSSYQRWDSYQYLSIAQDGYTLSVCEHDKNLFCGNSGWFPLYPLLIKALSNTGINLDISSVAVSWLLYALTLLMLLPLLVRHVPEQSKRIALSLLFSMFPGCIYFIAAFPISLTVFLAFATILSAASKCWSLTALFAVLASLTHPTGIYLGGALSLWLLGSAIKERKIKLEPWVGPLCSIFGFALVMVIHFYTVNNYKAFFVVQSSNGRKLSNPATLVDRAFISPLKENLLSRPSSSNTYSLRAFDGSFVSAIEGGGKQILIGAKKPVSWENFQEILVENGRIILQSFNGKFFRVDEKTLTLEVKADGQSFEQATRWQKLRPTFDRVVYLNDAGMYLGVDAEGVHLSARSNYIGPRELFEVITERDNYFRKLTFYTALQSLLVLFVIGSGLLLLLTRRLQSTAEILALNFAIISWFGSFLFGAGLSLYRVESTLVVSVLYLRRLPEWILWPLAILFGLISYPMAVMFFQTKLI